MDIRAVEVHMHFWQKRLKTGDYVLQPTTFAVTLFCLAYNNAAPQVESGRTAAAACYVMSGTM